MFDTFDHIAGSITIRIDRSILKISNKADMSIINDNICVGGKTKIEKLAKNGIDAILDLREEASDNLHDLQKYNIDFLQIKIKDRMMPNREDTKKIIKWLKSKVAKDKKIFIHCNLGRGRAPLVCCLYMVSCGMETDQAIKAVKKSRKYMYLNKNQLNYLRNFKPELD